MATEARQPECKPNPTALPDETKAEKEAEELELIFNPTITFIGGRQHGKKIGDTGQQEDRIDGVLYRRVPIVVDGPDGLKWKGEFLVCWG